MRERILKVAAQLGRKMSEGIVAEPGASERHRALGIADAYQILQDEFPEIFGDESKAEKPLTAEEVADIAVKAVADVQKMGGSRGKGFATTIDPKNSGLVIDPSLAGPQGEGRKGEQYTQRQNPDPPDQAAQPSQDSSSSHPEEPPRDSQNSEPND